VTSRLPLSLYICCLRDFTVRIKRLCWNIRSCWKPMASSPVLMKDDEPWQYLWYISYGHMRVKPNVCVDMVLYRQLTQCRISAEATEVSYMDQSFSSWHAHSSEYFMSVNGLFCYFHVGSSNYKTVVSDKCFAMVGRKCKSRQTGCSIQCRNFHCAWNFFLWLI